MSIQKYNPNQWEVAAKLSPQQITEYKKQGLIDRTSIRKGGKENADFVRKEIQRVLVKVADLCNAENLKRHTVVDAIIEFYAEDDQVYAHSLADLYRALTYGARGRYGETYGKVTFTQICNWIYAYEAERVKGIEDAYEKSKSNEPIDSRVSHSLRNLINREKNG